MRGSTAYTCGLTLPPVGDEAVKHDHAILGVTLLDGALLDDALLNDAPIDDALLLVIRLDLFVLVLYIGDLLLIGAKLILGVEELLLIGVLLDLFVLVVVVGYLLLGAKLVLFEELLFLVLCWICLS